MSFPYKDDRRIVSLLRIVIALLVAVVAFLGIIAEKVS